METLKGCAAAQARSFQPSRAGAVIKAGDAVVAELGEEEVVTIAAQRKPDCRENGQQKSGLRRFQSRIELLLFLDPIVGTQR